MANIIVFSYNLPNKRKSSGERRFSEILNILSTNHTIDFFSTDHNINNNKLDGNDLISTAKLSGYYNFDTDLFKSLLLQKNYDVCFIEFYWVANKVLGTLKKYLPNLPIIIDSVDVHFARQKTQADLGLLPLHQATKTKSEEIATYKQADIVLAVSDDDRRILAAEGVPNIYVIPNIVPSTPRVKKHRHPEVIFIGGYLWPPNVDAMHWFCTEIWPLILIRRPDATFSIIGSNPPDEFVNYADLPGVNVAGYQPDTAPFLDRAAVSVAPLRFGGGMKGKVNEALAHGIPVVTTSIGAQGFPAIDGLQMYIRDSPEQFADAVVKLLDDEELQYRIGLVGQQLNEEVNSPERTTAELTAAIGHAASIKKNCGKYRWRTIQIIQSLAKIFPLLKRICTTKQD